MTIASIGVLSCCLVITGIASLISVNVGRVVEYLGQQNEITAYLSLDLTDEQIVEIQDQVAALPNVLEYTFVSKQDALDEMKTWMAGQNTENGLSYEDLMQPYEGEANVLPASFRIKVDDLTKFGDTGHELTKIEGIDEVKSPQDLSNLFVSFEKVARFGGWALVIILAIVSIVVISNTIRLTVFARRKEIGIMKYVGATNTFIRMPFFVEGISVGLFSSLIASGIVCGLYYYILNYIDTKNTILWFTSLSKTLLTFNQAWPIIIIAFIIFGTVIGGIGTTTSVRKHLKV